MAHIAISRPDLFPPQTVVQIHPEQGGFQARGIPATEPVAEGVVGSDGWLRVTDDRLVRLTNYVAYAEIAGEPRQARLKATPA